MFANIPCTHPGQTQCVIPDVFGLAPGGEIPLSYFDGLEPSYAYSYGDTYSYSGGGVKEQPPAKVVPEEPPLTGEHSYSYEYIAEKAAEGVKALDPYSYDYTYTGADTMDAMMVEEQIIHSDKDYYEALSARASPYAPSKAAYSYDYSYSYYGGGAYAGVAPSKEPTAAEERPEPEEPAWSISYGYDYGYGYYGDQPALPERVQVLCDGKPGCEPEKVQARRRASASTAAPTRAPPPPPPAPPPLASRAPATSPGGPLSRLWRWVCELMAAAWRKLGGERAAPQAAPQPAVHPLPASHHVLPSLPPPSPPSPPPPPPPPLPSPLPRRRAAAHEATHEAHGGGAAGTAGSGAASTATTPPLAGEEGEEGEEGEGGEGAAAAVYGPHREVCEGSACPGARRQLGRRRLTGHSALTWNRLP